MTVLAHYNRAKVMKISSRSFHRAKITKSAVMSLMLVHYNLFLRSLVKEANKQARDSRSKVTKGEHVKAVAKRIILKYRR